MKTKKIILLIITLALVCVAGFSGVVGVFADELQRLQDIPFITISDSHKDSFGFCVNCKLNVNRVTDTGFTSSSILMISSFYDGSTGNLTGGSPPVLYPSVSTDSLSIGDYFSAPILIDRTNEYQTIAINFVLLDTYFDIFTDIPYITGFTLTNNDGTPFDYPSSSIVPHVVSNGLFFVVPPEGFTSTINVNVELAYRSYTDEQYQQTYENWVDAEYEVSLLEAENLDYQYQISDLNETIDNLNEDYDNLYNDWEEERDSKEHYQNLLREANNEIDNLENQIQQLDIIVEEQPVAAGFGWIAYAFEKVGTILEIELLPDISIGLLCLIPLVLGVVFFVLRLIRGE